MTGRTMRELVAEAWADRLVLNRMCIRVIDPVIEEKVPDMDKPLTSLDEQELKLKWYADKRFIREVDAVIHTNADLYSKGGMLEVGYNRFFLWAPTVWVSSKEAAGHLTVAKFEMDVICGNVSAAGYMVNARWKTWWQRFKWRLPIEMKGLPWLLWCHACKFF